MTRAERAKWRRWSLRFAGDCLWSDADSFDREDLTDEQDEIARKVFRMVAKRLYREGAERACSNRR